MSSRKPSKPKLDRWDIYNNIPHGGLTLLSDKCNCSVSQVKHVLEGKRTDHQNIIKEAEHMAAINIWKTRFCKLAKSEL